jgi:hypothetical protein
MELFASLFGDLLLMVYHCFDRLVINGYLRGLSRPDQVVYFFRDVVGVPVISKEVLSRRTNDYQHWVEAFAGNHSIPIEWAGKHVRKEDYVRPALRRMEQRQQYGVYYILKSMEQGFTFRSSAPRHPSADPHYRILAGEWHRFTHYYFYLRDERLGPAVVQVASFFPFQTSYYLNGHSFTEQELNRQGIAFRKHDNAFLAVADPEALQAAADRLTPALIRERLEYWTLVLGPKFSRRERAAANLRRFYAVRQVEYCRNFIFRRHFPIHRLFERSCELGLWRLTADQISEIFGTRLDRRLRGKLHSRLEQIRHGHHVFRAYWKNAFLRQYEKFSTFLRNELCSNDLTDFGLRKGLDHLAEARQKLLEVTDRFAHFQAQMLNVHVEFPVLERLAQPVQLGAARVPGIKIHDTRMIRLMEVMLAGSLRPAGARAAEIHQALLTTYGLSASAYGLNQLRYDLRKMRAHGLTDREGNRYSYRLTSRGVRVAVLFVLFHQRLCGPLAHSLFHRQPHCASAPASKLEAAFHEADTCISQIVELLQAA